MPELAQIPGSHHCIGTGRAIADLIFKNVIVRLSQMAG